MLCGYQLADGSAFAKPGAMECFRCGTPKRTARPAAFQPPSTVRLSPLMKADSGFVIKLTAEAISSTRANLPTLMIFFVICAAVPSSSGLNSVSMAPGCTSLTVTPVEPSSRERARVNSCAGTW